MKQCQWKFSHPFITLCHTFPQNIVILIEFNNKKCFLFVCRSFGNISQLLNSAAGDGTEEKVVGFDSEYSTGSRVGEQWEWLGWCRVQNILSWRMTVSSMTANGVIGSVAGHPWMLYRFGMTYDCKQQDLSPWFCICGNRVVDGVSCLPWNRCFCSFCISLDSFHFCVCTDWLTLLPHSYKGKLISIFIIPLR